MGKVAVATLPLVFVFKLDDWFEAHFHNSISVAIMLITYGDCLYLSGKTRTS